MIVGLIFCILQDQFAFIKFGDNLTAISAYPIALNFTDFILVFLTVSGIATIASGISARLSIKRLAEIKEDL